MDNIKEQLFVSAIKKLGEEFDFDLHFFVNPSHTKVQVLFEEKDDVLQSEDNFCDDVKS